MHLVAVLYHTGQFDVLNAILCQWRSFLSVVYVLDCSLCILLYCTDFVLYLARVTFPTLNYDGAKYEVLEINVGNCESLNQCRQLRTVQRLCRQQAQQHARGSKLHKRCPREHVCASLRALLHSGRLWFPQPNQQHIRLLGQYWCTGHLVWRRRM